VVDAEPVDERQILIDAFDPERAGVVDRGELDRLSIDRPLLAFASPTNPIVARS
jgi:hypothetical protein